MSKRYSGLFFVLLLMLGGCAKPMRIVTSTPSGASIYADKYPIGTTPLTTAAPPYGLKCWSAGNYTAKLEGYKSMTQFFRGGCEDFTVDFPLELLTTIKREINSSPDEAMVYFGKDLKKLKKGIKSEIEVGQTPFKDERNDEGKSEKPKWEAGYYRAVLKGYRPKIIEVTESDKDLKLDFNMTILPKFPDPPKVVFPDPKSVIIQPVNPDYHREPLLNITQSTKFAIVPFKDSQGMGAGSLVADMLMLQLKKHGYQIVDRETIDRILKEQEMISGRKTSSDDLELAKKIGQIESFDYMITGAINDYSAKSENVKISPNIPRDEVDRYVSEYLEFVNYYTNEADEKERPSRYPNTIQQWEMEYASKPRDHYLSMARIGLSSKMIKLENTKIVWIGLASTTDLSLQVGTKRVVDDMIMNFTTSVIPVGEKAKENEPVAVELKE